MLQSSSRLPCKLPQPRSYSASALANRALRDITPFTPIGNSASAATHRKNFYQTMEVTGPSSQTNPGASLLWETTIITLTTMKMTFSAVINPISSTPKMARGAGQCCRTTARGTQFALSNSAHTNSSSFSLTPGIRLTRIIISAMPGQCASRPMGASPRWDNMSFSLSASVRRAKTAKKVVNPRGENYSSS